MPDLRRHGKDKALMATFRVSKDGALTSTPVLEARQFTGNNCLELLHWMGVDAFYNPDVHTTDHPIVHTPDGEVTTEVGDWILKVRS
jgi:hypothetical protein